MQKTILFLPATIHSHVLPSLFVAGLLREEYGIHYAVTSEALAGLVATQGYDAKVTSNYRVTLGMEARYLHEVKQLSGKWNILKCIRENEILTHRQNELFSLVDQIKPTAIFIDIFNSTDMLVLFPKYHKTVKLIFLNPMLSTYRINGYPTVDQAHWPKEHENQPVKNQRKGIPLKMYFTQPLDVMISKAMDRQLEKMIAAEGFSVKHPLAKDRTNTLLFDHIPEVILAPLELEVSPDVRKRNQYYLGLCTTEKKMDTQLDESFEIRFDSILKSKSKGNKIVYCTFGTFYQGSDKALLDFLNKLIDALESVTDIVVIFSVNDLVIQTLSYQRQLPDTFHFFTRVPQLKVLKHADLYVTHGGLGSVKESLQYGVPMLVYPLDPHYDQNGNGLKVEHHGLGLRGVFHHERSVDMKRKIEELLSDEKYKSNIAAFNKTCASKYSVNNLKTVVNALID
ncbi:nucleotide disphospho-sugar-binding domain-containing protein [Dyadobacter jejuensis]|nr:glycosyltransferase [Dyadobacter jejuensis]